MCIYMYRYIGIGIYIYIYMCECVYVRVQLHVPPLGVPSVWDVGGLLNTQRRINCFLLKPPRSPSSTILVQTTTILFRTLPRPPKSTVMSVGGGDLPWFNKEGGEGHWWPRRSKIPQTYNLKSLLWRSVQLIGRPKSEGVHVFCYAVCPVSSTSGVRGRVLYKQP